MVLVVAEKKIGFVSQILRKMREPFFQIGRVVKQPSRRGPKVVFL
jgi:rRNA processing protein Gar1